MSKSGGGSGKGARGRASGALGRGKSSSSQVGGGAAASADVTNQAPAATISRGEELRAKYGSAEKGIQGRFPDDPRRANYKGGPTPLEGRISGGAGLRNARKTTDEFRKAKAITRSEADDKAIQNSINRRARKTGKDVTINTRISPDRDSAATTYKFELKGSSAKGGNEVLRAMGRQAKETKKKNTKYAAARAKSRQPGTIKTTARKRVSTSKIKRMDITRNLDNIFDS